MSLTFAQTKTNLNVMLSNTAGFAFNDQEVTQFLTDAWQDKWAVTPVWDSSLTFRASTYQYTLPSTVTTVSSVYIERSTSNLPEPISAELWEVVNGILQFNDRAYQTIPDSTQLFLRGKYKVLTTDSLSDVGLQQYIISLAAYNALRYLLYKKTLQFLRNDTSVAEIIATRRELFADLIQWRHQLGNEFVDQ
jgi:hypothetical protein